MGTSRRPSTISSASSASTPASAPAALPSVFAPYSCAAAQSMMVSMRWGETPSSSTAIFT
jgi:hypothetical protein